MAVFFYQATDRKGKVIQGDVEADDFKTAVLKVRRLNYFPIKVAPDQARPRVSANALANLDWFKGVSQKELMNFTQQLATLVAAGLTLDKSLAITVNLTEKEATRQTFADIQKRVHSGTTFAESLALHPKVFSKLYISMVRAGEVGGVLDTVLFRLAGFLESARDMKSKITSALIYPTILLVAGLAALIFLMTVVMPKFLVIFEGAGNALPMVTRIFMGVIGFVNQYIWILLGIALVTVIGTTYYLKTEAGRLAWDRLLLRMPIIGDLIRKIEVSRFSRTMATLLKSGVPVLQSLQIVQTIITNRIIAQAMKKLREGLRGGQGFAKPLQSIGMFPPLAIHMIVVGEETGAIEDMLNQVADTFDKEVDIALKRVLNLIPIIIIIILGLGIGFMVVGVLVGMLSISSIIF